MFSVQTSYPLPNLLSLNCCWCVVLLLLVISPSAAVAGDLTLDWETIETEHFLIHYHSGLDELPERMASICEETHMMLTPFFDWHPREKTHVVLDDTIDTSNGFATVVPRNMIRLFLYGPVQRSSLGDYDDWLRTLFIHEYAHILHIDTIGGVPSWINRVIGKTSTPNQVMPRWYTEGVATYIESSRTSGGRVRSSLMKMYLRTAYLEDDLMSLDQITGAPHSWPGGGTPYLYGSHFLAYVAQTRGESFFKSFHKSYGERLMPYGLNTTLREVLGEDFVTLYGEWLVHLAARSEAELLTIRAQGVTPLDWVTGDGERSEQPVSRPGYPMVTFFSSPGAGPTGIYSYNLKSGALELLTPIEFGGQSHSWDSSGRYMIYHANRTWRSAYAFNDLFIYDSATARHNRLTYGLRARDPVFVSGGRGVIFVRNAAGRTELELMPDITTPSERRVLVRSGVQGQMDTPQLTPDGRLVAFSFWRPGEGRDVYVKDLKTGRLFQVTRDRALDLEPSFTSDGARLLFSSDRAGVYDIYAVEVSELIERADALGELEGEARVDPEHAEVLILPVSRLTRVERGVFSPRLVSSGDEAWLFMVAYNKNGFNLAKMRQSSTLEMAVGPSTIVRPAVTYPVSTTPVMSTEEYASTRYLAPLSVYPLFAFNNSGRDSYGLELFGGDPVGHHLWSMVADYADETESVLLLGSYAYNRLPVGLGFGLQYATYELPRSMVRGEGYVPFEEQAIDGQLRLSKSLGAAALRQQVQVGYNLRFTSVLEAPAVVNAPGDLSPQDPAQGNFSSLSFSWTVSDRRGYGDSVVAEEGYELGLTLRVRDRVLGSDYSSVEARYAADVYQGVPWLDNHAVRLSLQGGVGRSNFLRRELFSLGGLPPQELVTAVINETPLGGSYLRGFEPFAFRGEQYHLMTPSYNFPVLDMHRGFDTLPLYLGRLSFSGFVDVGAAFNGPVTEADLQVGAGGRLRLDVALGYILPASFQLGYAHGFGSRGIDDIFFYFGSSN